MASSGYFYSKVGITGRYNGQWRIDWETISRDEDSNTSTITWSISLVNGSAYVGDFVLAIDGIKLMTWSNIYPPVKNYCVLTEPTDDMFTGEYTITHNSEGDASFTFNFICAIDSINSIYTYDENFSLDPFTKVATVSSTNAYIGNDITITIGKQSTSSIFTYSLSYTFGELSGNITTSTTNTTTYWTLPTGFYNQMAKEASKSGVITCKTYRNGTLEGSSTCSFTAMVDPNENSPILNPIIEDGNTFTNSLTGDVNTFIRYQSTAVYYIGAEARNGATIVSQSVRCADGQVAYGEAGEIPRVGSGTFSVVATDSRDIITSEVIQKNIIDYIKLTCNMSNDKPSIEGSFDFTISGNYFNDSFGLASNELTVEYRYKAKNGEYSAWTQVMPVVNEYTYEAKVSLSGFQYQTVYIFECRATDVFGSVYTAEKSVRSLPVFDWSENDFNFNVPITYTDVEGTGETYSLSEMAKGFQLINDETFAQISGLTKALTQRYELTTYVGATSYYSNVDVSLYLYGNTIRGYMSATRNTAASPGNVANELVCQVEFDSGGKVTGFGQVAFTSGTEGGLASFQMTDTYVYPDDGSVSEEAVGRGLFSIRLCAVDTASDKWNAYFTFPCILDLTKF